MIRERIHNQLCAGFGVHVIHSEYGTELLQAYSLAKFECPTWMQIIVRDKMRLHIPHGKTGDQCNRSSQLKFVLFHSYQDLGKKSPLFLKFLGVLIILIFVVVI
jgi:hypothetical protein